MKLYVCWGTFQTIRPGGHPCANAHRALQRAGHDPEVVKVQGLGVGPDFVHIKTAGRKQVERLCGRDTVPVLVTDEDEMISDSKRIVAWAEANPAPVSPGAPSSP